MSSHLFSPIVLGSMELHNRIVVSPMCQYSAHKGCVGDWHTMHVGQFAVANPGLIILEGTAVEAQGMISAHDHCLFSDEHEEALAHLVRFVSQHSDTKLGVQLFHSGRKGSQKRPWEGGATIPVNSGGWETLAPSALRYNSQYPLPREADESDIARIEAAFADAAKRAFRAGVDTVEVHYAHGYYLHTWLSGRSNKRKDQHGGDFENRIRHPLAVFDAVTSAASSGQPVGARISGTDYEVDPTGWTIEDAKAFGLELKQRNCAYLDVSTGFLSEDQVINYYGPSFQLPYASAIRQVTGLPTMTVGAITGAHEAEKILQSREADMIALGRGALFDPRWPWHAAKELGEEMKFPPQYERAITHGFPKMFDLTR